MDERKRTILKVSVVGIITNLILVGIKASIGMITHSIAVTSDALNNFTDSLSSLITMIGTVLSNKKPDKKHPMGYGRIEYISASIVGAIVLYAGITAFISGVKELFHPTRVEYTNTILVTLFIGVIIKFVLGVFTKKQGKLLESNSLVASGSDAFNDAILSSSVLISALLSIYFNLYFDALIACVFSFFIIRSGYDMWKQTLDDMIGKRMDATLAKKIQKIVLEKDGVLGIHDLFLTNYGPRQNFVSFHIELMEDTSVKDVDVLSRTLQEEIYRKLNVIVSAIGVYSINHKDSFAYQVQKEIDEIVSNDPWAMQMHGFYVDTELKKIRFDVVIKFGISVIEAIETLTKQIQERYPGYEVSIVADRDTSDI